MATEIYFLKTHYVKPKTRMVALPNQSMMVDGKVHIIDETWNVQCDKDIRSKFPLGTVFATNSMVVKAGFYQAGQVFPIVPEGEAIIASVVPADEIMRSAYDAFITKSKVIKDVKKAETVAPDASRKRTLLNRLSSRHAVPDIEECGFYVDADIWYLLLRNMKGHVNTMLIGPTGTGKTEITSLVAEELGMELSIFDMGSMYDPISSLLGVHRLTQDGKSEFDYAAFTHSMRKPGIVLLDELSRAPISTNNILFPCLDSRRSLPVEMAGGHDMRAISLDEGVAFMATANIGGEYTGTNILDRALRDRFMPVELGYMPDDKEVKVLVKRIEVDTSVAHIIVGVAKTLRALASKGEISTSVSTRHTLLIAALQKDGFSLSQAMQLVLLPLYEGTRTEGERAVVLATLQGM